VLQKLGADAVAPILVGELDHDDRLHRWGAVRGLALIDVPAALPRLAQRAFDPEQRIASLAVEVLGSKRHNPHFPAVLGRLRDLCRRGDDFERLRAVRAVAALRDPGAIGVLIDLLSTRPRDIADEARTALIEITCQDFGGAERRWRAWLADHGALPRRRWLLDALAHKDVALRKAAADELRDDGVALFDYRADAPLKEREAALAALARSAP
jgi:HEAT repeat protein